MHIIIIYAYYSNNITNKIEKEIREYMEGPKLRYTYIVHI